MSRSTFEQSASTLRVGLFVSLLLAMVLSVTIQSLMVLSAFDQAVAPEIETRTKLLGSFIRTEIQNQLQLGIPIDAINGLDRYLDDTMLQFDEVRKIAVFNERGNVIAVAERQTERSLLQESGLGEAIGVRGKSVRLPILYGNAVVGDIRVETSAQFIETRLKSVFLDIVVLAFVVLLIGIEFTFAIVAASIWKPMGRVAAVLKSQGSGDFRHTISERGVARLSRAAEWLNDQARDLARRISVPERLAAQGYLVVKGTPLRLRFSDVFDVRLSLFLFAIATEVTSSFMPIFARSVDRPEWLSAELAAAVPTIIYITALAIVAPFAGGVAKRFGARRVFVAAACIAGIALAGMGLSSSLVGVTLWRGVMAVFYGLATVCCHQYALSVDAERGESRASGAFAAMIMGGAFCGTVLGGVISGRLGFGSALLFGAGLAVLAAILGYAAMNGRAGVAVKEDTQPKTTEGSTPSQQRTLVGVIVGVSIPMAISAVVFIGYLTPLMLSAEGRGTADISRVIMLYFLVAIIAGPMVNGLAKGVGGLAVQILLGALVTATSLAIMQIASGFLVHTLVVVGVGLGHTLIRAPLGSLISQLAGTGALAMNILRLAERAGALMGLVAGALILPSLGSGIALLCLSILVYAGAIVFVVFWGATLLKPKGSKIQ